jgi:hypothetical protein
MRLRVLLLVAVFCAAFAPPVSADVRVSFANGRVTVIAENATVREILEEWARVGGSTFVDAEKIPSLERLTIRLENQTELDAIDVLLRSVAGYMVAPAGADPTVVSSIARVFILPTSTPVAYIPPPPVEIQADEDAAPARVTATPPQPDDDGPVRVQVPPAIAAPAPVASPFGQASPLLDNSSTQTAPGPNGAVTSSQPGVVINPARPRPPGGRPVTIQPIGTDPKTNGAPKVSIAACSARMPPTPAASAGNGSTAATRPPVAASR